MGVRGDCAGCDEDSDIWRDIDNVGVAEDRLDLELDHDMDFDYGHERDPDLPPSRVHEDRFDRRGRDYHEHF